VAIYSLNHRPIGKTTQARPNTAAAHIRYISRKPAATHVDGRGIPTDPKKARAFFLEAESLDRKNARVADKVMVALPKELDAEQRKTLVRRFAEDVTKGRAPWYAAIHDQGKDAQNPHAHLVFRDRDPETGRRVIGLSESGSTERLRKAWEFHANEALSGAGRAERIDRRTLDAQGVRRRPTIHEGPRSRAMKARGAEPRSQRRQVRNQPRARNARRWVDYPKIDRGRSRPDYNRSLESPAELWEAVDNARQRRDFAQLAPHQAPGLPEKSATTTRRPLVQPMPTGQGARLPSLTHALSQAAPPQLNPVASFKPPPLSFSPDELTRRKGLKR
jgi:hypothetical protein